MTFGNPHGNIMQHLNSSRWSLTNPSQCPCRGRGWLTSDYDTSHECRYHGGTPHPEGEDEGFDWDAHKGRTLLKAFEVFRSDALVDGLKGSFLKACFDMLHTDTPTPADWVNAAQDVAADCAYEATEAQAKREGYSCGLEMRYAQEAAQEAAQAAQW